MPYLTGDDPGASVTSFTLDIPDDFNFRTAVYGALLELADPQNWEQIDGELSPQQCADLAFEMFDTLQADE